MDRDQSVCIIMPAYNEQDGIGIVLENLVSVATENKWEVIVVDDGSTDSTAEIAEKSGVKVVQHSQNRGYGASLSTGVKNTDAEIVVFMDSDGQHNHNDIELLLAHIDKNDMVVGARTADSHTDLYRRPGKSVLKWFADYLAGEKIPDVNSGFRAFKRKVLLNYLHLMPEGFSFSTTSTFAMLKGSHQIKWVPITTAKRTGTSTVRQLKHGPGTMMLMLRLTVLFDPLRVFLPISGVLMLLAIIMTVLNLILYRRAVPASAVLFAITAVIIFMLGLVTDQVSAIRREQHRKI